MSLVRNSAQRKIIQIAGLCGPGAIAGGVWAVAQTQTQLLRDQGADVNLVGGWLGEPPRESYSQFLQLRRPFPGAGLRGLVGIGLTAWLQKHLAGRDVAHIHLARDFITTQSLRLAAKAGLGVVVQSHGMISVPDKATLRLFDALFKKWYLRYPTLWLALSQKERDSLVRYGVSAEKIVVVPNTVVGTRQSWVMPSTELFVFISRLHERKQPEVFVRSALTMLDDGRNSRFLVVGPDQGERAKIESLIDGSGHEEKITIVGSMASAEVEEILASCTALVLPSRDEIVPMIVLEAAAIGAPIILTSDCHLTESFRNADAALVIEPTVEDTTHAMVRLGDNPDLALELSKNGRKHFLERWSPQTLLRSLLDVYSRAA